MSPVSCPGELETNPLHMLTHCCLWAMMHAYSSPGPLLSGWLCRALLANSEQSLTIRFSSETLLQHLAGHSLCLGAASSERVQAVWFWAPRWSGYIRICMRPKLWSTENAWQGLSAWALSTGINQAALLNLITDPISAHRASLSDGTAEPPRGKPCFQPLLLLT